jgi:hypothetical protein
LKEERGAYGGDFSSVIGKESVGRWWFLMQEKGEFLKLSVWGFEFG